MALRPAWTESIEHNDVPDTCRDGVPVCLGVDEAGRGPVLGPMVYGAAYWPIALNENMGALGFADSKALSAEQRERLFESLRSSGRIGWMLRVITPIEISARMLQRVPYNLNYISHDACIALVQRAVELGVNVQEVYVDTVGDPGKYESKLTARFESRIKFTVRKKADSLFPVVSAASICAKVTRDQHVAGHVFAEQHLQRVALEAGSAGGKALLAVGSGYPGDPTTKAWLRSQLDPVFGLPSLVRFSWSTAAKLLDDSAARVEWPAEDDDEVDTAQRAVKRQRTLASMLAPAARSKSVRCSFLTDRGLEPETEL